MLGQITHQSASRGFTLVELLVVLAIVAVMLGMVGVGAGHIFANNSRDADRLALQRLSLAIERGSDLAQTRGQAIRLDLAGGGYRFLARDDFGRWGRVGNDAWLAEREVPEGWRWLKLESDGELLSPPYQLHFYGEPVSFSLRIATGDSNYLVAGSSAGVVRWTDQQAAP